MPRPSRNPRAFSLIELLVVVSVIALLIGILLPTLGGARDTARLTVCGSNLKQLATALHAYAADEQGRLAAGPAGPSPFGRNWTDVNGAGIWIGGPFQAYLGHGLLLDHYLKEDKDAYYCPGDDTNAPTVQLAKIGTIDNALSSYAYRHLSQTSAHRLDDLGVNELGTPARAVLMDTESYGPTPDTYHSAHNGVYLVVAYADGHIRRLRNDGQRMAIPPSAFASLPDFTAVFRAGDQVFANADHALLGNLDSAPTLP